MASEIFERVVSTCFACGKPLDQVRDLPSHRPDPASEAERCRSRPRKYSHLQCMYANGHECQHTAKVTGTGLHCWGDGDALT